MKDRGFSDKLYWLNFQMTWIFVWSCLLVTMLSGLLNITDLSILGIAIGAAFTELGLHTSLILWKAKVENCEKNKKENIIEWIG